MANNTTVYSAEITLPDLQALDEAETESIQAELNNGLRVQRLRLLSFVEPLDPEKFESSRRGQMARMKQEWRRGYLEEEARVIRLNMETTPAWCVRHWLLSWGQPLLALSKYATESPPPDPLGGERNYESLPDYLRPVRMGGLFAKIIGAYQYKNCVWNWVWPWATLITRADGPMVALLDMERIPEKDIRMARRGLQNLTSVHADDDDTRRLAANARRALEAQEDAYQTRLLVLLRDASAERLMERAKRLAQTFESALAFSLLPGQQYAALQFFNDVPQVSMPMQPSTVLVSALPVAVSGLAGITNKPRPKGIYVGFRVGMNAQSLGPIHFLGWQGNQAYHTGFLGRIGAGKTVSMMALLSRERATHHVPIVFLEPMGNSKKLARLLGPEGYDDPGLRYHPLDWDNIQLNPLDYIGVNDAEQESHLVALFQVMLDRRLENLEKVFIGRAMRQVYTGLHQDDLDRPEKMPRPEHLCQALRELRGSYAGNMAEHLAEEIGGLYVSGGQSVIFNRQTNIYLGFDGADLYNAQAVAGNDDDAFKTILYYMMFSAFYRRARRDKEAGLRIPRIIGIDEYSAMSRNPYLARRLEILIRTMRNFDVALWLADQNLASFSGLSPDANEMGVAGHVLMTNIPYWFAFKLAIAETRLLRREFGRRCPQGFADFLPNAVPGQGIAMLDQTQLVNFNLLPTEAEALL